MKQKLPQFRREEGTHGHEWFDWALRQRQKNVSENMGKKEKGSRLKWYEKFEVRCETDSVQDGCAKQGVKKLVKVGLLSMRTWHTGALGMRPFGKIHGTLE